ncbi:MAG TPA: hypothetical protein VJ576_03065 [Rhodocyclaceae bacterium]|nr:hypothetical protein [Rhodocyclaceae bacterium]
MRHFGLGKRAVLTAAWLAYYALAVGLWRLVEGEILREVGNILEGQTGDIVGSAVIWAVRMALLFYLLRFLRLLRPPGRRHPGRLPVGAPWRSAVPAWEMRSTLSGSG